MIFMDNWQMKPVKNAIYLYMYICLNVTVSPIVCELENGTVCPAVLTLRHFHVCN